MPKTYRDEVYLDEMDLTMNETKSEGAKHPQCPLNKEKVIKKALKHLKML